MEIEIPLFDEVRIASPCEASWEAMRPVDGDRVRFCKQCKKSVYNFSAMTREEAEALLIAHNGRLCARYYEREDGKILTADCPVGKSASERGLFARIRRWFRRGKSKSSRKRSEAAYISERAMMGGIDAHRTVDREAERRREAYYRRLEQREKRQQEQEELPLEALNPLVEKELEAWNRRAKQQKPPSA